MALSKQLRSLAALLWGANKTNDLWQRIIKCSIACTVAIIIASNPRVMAVYGASTFLTPMVTVFAHPGQRMGMMIESLLLILFGSLIGLAWAMLGLFLSSLVFVDNASASYAIRGIFLLVSVLVHGYIRSSSPRLFTFVSFLLIGSVMVLLGGSSHATQYVFTRVYYPILTGGAVVIVVNLAIFPELSSSFLGLSTIDTLCETMDTLERATHWFVTPGGDFDPNTEHNANLGATMTRKSTVVEKPKKKKKKKSRFRKFLDEFPNPFQTIQSRYRDSTQPVESTKLHTLTGSKAKIRTRLAKCKAAQKEINFEITHAALPPSSMKPLSTSQMSDLVQSAITLIGACENKFIVLENDGKSTSDDATINERLQRVSTMITSVDTKEEYLRRLEKAKPMREIETSSADLLESVILRIREPVQEFQESLKEAVTLVVSCLAYCYDVPKLPSGARAPDGILLQELDLRVDEFKDALARFDDDCAFELRRAALNETGQSADFMPRMETFLVSSFVLGFRQAALQVLHMLKHVRKVVEQRQSRNDRAQFWFPRHTSIRQWLTTGGENDFMILPESARKTIRRAQTDSEEKPSEKKTPAHSDPISPGPKDEEDGVRQVLNKERTVERRRANREERRRKNKKNKSKDDSQHWCLKVRGKAADTLEWVQESDDIAYALKLAIAVFLVSWPALIVSWNGWYTEVRGVWAPMQLVLVFEVAIGSSFFIFFLRLFGVVFGCVMGLLSFLIGRGTRVGMVFILILGIVPSVYVQLGTKYVKAGMISTVTMSVVALASISNYGTAYENFYKRLCAFIIGGLVALLVELIIYPVRARDRMLESLSASVKQVQNMQAAMAVGIDTPMQADYRSAAVIKRFNQARNKARAALAAANTFLPFCSTEPRLKGSFKPHAPIYKEIIYVLHQIIDRMDNSVQLRKEYGSSILEDLNPQVHTYRRNVAASVVLVLFSVNEALTTWQPLPQFIPSTRIAQLRMINRVREVLAMRSGTQTPAGLPPTPFLANGELDKEVARLITQKKFLSWNASVAGQMEIIEYLEELIELVKLLVGVNAFRSGLLEKPDYTNYRNRRPRMDQQDHQQGRLSPIHSIEEAAPYPAEAIHTAASTYHEPTGTGDLQRTKTIRERAGQMIKDKLLGKKDGDATEEETDDEEEIPTSLQRVGTRLYENNAVVRRRAFTLSNEQRP